MIRHPIDTYGDNRSPTLAAFQNTDFTKPPPFPLLPVVVFCSSKYGALSFTYVHAQMKNKRVVMNEFKSKSADMFLSFFLFF